MDALLFVFFLFLFGKATPQDCIGYEEHPLIVVSMDGFRVEYLSRGITPNIQAVKDRGVSVPYMKASYPTVTFPNHYTIVTGLYPESHGIIANSFYDPAFDESFYIGSDQSLEGRWWGGEPIWNTVVKQGKKSATFFWPGSDADVQGMHPTYYYRYDGAVPYEDRVDQVLDWLSLPESERPSWICLYFDEPDHTGHEAGPVSEDVNTKLVYVDSMIERLVGGIADQNSTDCVNLILLADHGMTQSGQARRFNLTDFVPDLDELAVTYQGAAPRIDVEDQYEDETEDIRRNLTCQQPELRQYSQPSLPKRFHYSNNARIGDIVLDLNLGYAASVESDFYMEGDHGYDNYYEDMQPIFIAAGPEFPPGVTVEPFQNIELYNFMCDLVGVIPAPNNGTQSSLSHLLVSPPPYPSIDQETPPPVPAFPDEAEIDERMHISGCPGDDNAPLSLNFTQGEEEEILDKHLPWGIPLSGDLPADLILLYQEDHVAGYSQKMKVSLWTSFTIEQDPVNQVISDWSSDIRLTSENTPTCDHYDQLASLNFSMQLLFPNRYGSASSAVNFIVSNSVPMTEELIARWNYLTETLLSQWFANSTGPLNVVAGPLFDLNSDSIVDNFDATGNPLSVPSDLFLIVTRCLFETSSLNDCGTDNLDSLAFIFPEHNSVPNCLDMNQFALKFSSKVKDVEIASGFTFFPLLPYEDRTRLAIRVHSSLWA